MNKKLLKISILAVEASLLAAALPVTIVACFSNNKQQNSNTNNQEVNPNGQKPQPEGPNVNPDANPDGQKPQPEGPNVNPDVKPSIKSVVVTNEKIAGFVNSLKTKLVHTTEVEFIEKFKNNLESVKAEIASKLVLNKSDISDVLYDNRMITIKPVANVKFVVDNKVNYKMKEVIDTPQSEQDMKPSTGMVGELKDGNIVFSNIVFATELSPINDAIIKRLVELLEFGGSKFGMQVFSISSAKYSAKLFNEIFGTPSANNDILKVLGLGEKYSSFASIIAKHDTATSSTVTITLNPYHNFKFDNDIKPSTNSFKLSKNSIIIKSEYLRLA